MIPSFRFDFLFNTIALSRELYICSRLCELLSSHAVLHFIPPFLVFGYGSFLAGSESSDRKMLHEELT
jgi:hypothetical protein